MLQRPPDWRARLWRLIDRLACRRRVWLYMRADGTFDVL